MVQLIKKGGLRERANRSRKFQGSENTETTLKPNSYAETTKNATTVNLACTQIQETNTQSKTSEQRRAKAIEQILEIKHPKEYQYSVLTADTTL